MHVCLFFGMSLSACARVCVCVCVCVKVCGGKGLLECGTLEGGGGDRDRGGGWGAHEESDPW